MLKHRVPGSLFLVPGSRSAFRVHTSEDRERKGRLGGTRNREPEPGTWNKEPGTWNLCQVYHRAVRLVLASQSPRRAELLERAGFDFDVVSAQIDEAPLAGETPRAHVLRLAAAKADAVVRRLPERVVLGADTVVVVDGHLLGKPVDDRDAARILRLLAGRVHEVLTGVVLRDGARAVSGVDTTRVHFTSLTDETIARYVATGEPRGKAGAYAIQGIASRFVDWIEGSYTNVVGLPVTLVDRLLHELFPGA